MKKARIAFLVFGGMALFAVGTIFWFQADKEVDFLCHYFKPGAELAALQNFVETVELSEVQKSADQWTVSSAFLGNSVCTIDFHQQNITQLVFSQKIRLALFFSLMGAPALLGLILFQVLLAAGKPYGEFAWGGVHKKLPKSLRIASGISGAVLIFAFLVLLNGGGIISLFPQKITHDALAGFTILFGLSLLGNTQSKSPKERKIMIPLSILMLGCFYVVMASLW